jgi:diguanylate cyclase (GGDEF)-like protein
MRQLIEGTDAEINSEELRRFVRSTTAVEILSLVLVGLVAVLSSGLVQSAPALTVLMCAFAAAIAAFSWRRIFPRETRFKIALQSWTMVAFVTGVLWLTGKGASPLTNFYVLPIVLSALSLGRLATLLQVALIAVCHMALAAETPSIEVFSLEYASVAVGQLFPFLLIAYLTTALTADISAARKRIENLGQIDALTGLLNINAFNRLWQAAHAAAVQQKQKYALVSIDLERLNSINDSFGHEAGNSALCLVAQCLLRCIRTSDIAARFGGDEFVLLLPSADTAAADAVIKRIRSSVYGTTLDLRARMVRCSVNIGVAIFQEDARDPRELLALASKRMNRDKELRRAPDRAVNA